MRRPPRAIAGGRPGQSSDCLEIVLADNQSSPSDAAPSVTRRWPAWRGGAGRSARGTAAGAGYGTTCRRVLAIGRHRPAPGPQPARCRCLALHRGPGQRSWPTPRRHRNADAGFSGHPSGLADAAAHSGSSPTDPPGGANHDCLPDSDRMPAWTDSSPPTWRPSNRARCRPAKSGSPFTRSSTTTWPLSRPAPPPGGTGPTLAPGRRSAPQPGQGQHYFSMKLIEGGSLAGRWPACAGRPAGRGAGWWRRSPGRCTTRTSAASCTATSSRPTSCSTPRARRTSPTSAWPSGSRATAGLTAVRRDRRHARLHGPGAGRGPSKGMTHGRRRLRPGGHPVRAADRPAAVPRRRRPLETLSQVLRAARREPPCAAQPAGRTATWRRSA